MCGAVDAFIETIRDGAEYYVECATCHVYRASRRAFRLFQYLRGRGDCDSLDRLERLATRLHARGREIRNRSSCHKYQPWSALQSQALSAPAEAAQETT